MSCVRLNKLFEISPVKSLKESFKTSNLSRFSSEGRILPSNLLYDSSNVVSCVRLNNPSRISPVKSLEESAKILSFSRFPSEDEIRLTK